MTVTYDLDMYFCVLIFMFIPLQDPQCVAYSIIKTLSSWHKSYQYCEATVILVVWAKLYIKLYGKTETMSITQTRKPYHGLKEVKTSSWLNIFFSFKTTLKWKQLWNVYWKLAEAIRLMFYTGVLVTGFSNIVFVIKWWIMDEEFYWLY